MWSADIFFRSIFYCIFVRLNSLIPRKHTVGHLTLQIAHRHVCLIDLAAYYKTAASLSGRKRTKYVVCEMAQNPLEVSMEVPITGIKYLVSAPISVLFSTHRLPPQGDKGTELLDSMQGQKTCRTRGFFSSSPFILKQKFQFAGW